MKIKAIPLDIPDDDIFKNDKLQRAESVDNLTKLIKTISQPFVLSINSPWGTGKTTFINLWRKKLKQEKIYTIYYNAWESDYSHEPLLSFISEVNGQISAITTKTEVQEKLKKFKEIGGKVLLRTIPLAVKLATAGLLNFDDFTDESIAGEAEKLTNKQISQYEKNKETVIEFKSKLKGLVKELGEQNLIIFVDELDRCKPTYAVELLEHIKHLFNVEGIIFVLSIDKNQLEASVKKLFGEHTEFEGYFKKFLDLTFNLPKPSTESFINSLFDSLGLFEYFRQVQTNKYFEEFAEIFSVLADAMETDYRTIEQISAQINIIIRIDRSAKLFLPDVLVFLLLVKYKNHSLFQQFCFGQVSYRTLLELISSSSKGKEFLKTFYGTRFEAQLIKLSKEKNEAINKLETELKNSNAGSINYKRNQELWSYINDSESIYGFYKVEQLYKKIELTEKFHI